jgi:hypothetical protein
MSWGDVGVWITAIAAVLALLGSYVQFVLKPSVLPSAEFDVDFASLYRDSEHLYGEVAVVMKNVGSNTLVVENVRYRLRYLASTPVHAYSKRSSEPLFTPLPDPQGEERYTTVPDPPTKQPPSDDAGEISLPVGPSEPSQLPSPPPSGEPQPGLWFALVTTRTFIQPGVTQNYRKPVMLPPSTFLVDVVAAFDYKFKLRRVRTFLVKLSDPAVSEIDWTRGISNHTVRHTIHLHP